MDVGYGTGSPMIRSNFHRGLSHGTKEEGCGEISTDSATLHKLLWRMVPVPRIMAAQSKVASATAQSPVAFAPPAVGPLEKDHYLANPEFVNDQSGNPCPPVSFMPKEGTISSVQLWRSSHICEFTELPGRMSYMLGIEGPEAPQPTLKCI